MIGSPGKRIPSQVKKKLTKIIECENGDEDGNKTRYHGSNEEHFSDNHSLMNLDDEDSSEDE